MEIIYFHLHLIYQSSAAGRTIMNDSLVIHNRPVMTSHDFTFYNLTCRLSLTEDIIILGKIGWDEFCSNSKPKNFPIKSFLFAYEVY